MITHTWEFSPGRKNVALPYGGLGNTTVFYRVHQHWTFCFTYRRVHSLFLRSSYCVCLILSKRKTKIKRTIYFRANVWRRSKSVSSYSVILLGFSLYQNSTRSHFTLWYILKTATTASSCQFRSFPRRSLCRTLANALEELWRDFLVFSQLFLSRHA